MLTPKQRSDGWGERGNIPNLHGYKVTLLLRNGSEVAASVYKNAATGLHSLIDTNTAGVPIATVAGWKARK